MALLNASRNSLIDEALTLWSTYAEIYRTTIYRYLFLIDWKAELQKHDKKIRVGRIPKYVLDDFPDLPLFQFVDRDTTRIWLEKMSASEIRYIINRTKFELEFNHAYRTVSSRIIELSYEMAHFGEKSHPFGVIDTEFRNSGPFSNGKRSRHTSQLQ